MAWQEKYESGVNEKIVFCDTAKHKHEAALIKSIEKALGEKLGGIWTVRANSYKAVDKAPAKSMTFKELGLK